MNAATKTIKLLAVGCYGDTQPWDNVTEEKCVPSLLVQSGAASPPNELWTRMSYLLLLLAEVSSLAVGCCRGFPLASFTDLIVAWPSFSCNLARGKGAIAQFKGSGR